MVAHVFWQVLRKKFQLHYINIYDNVHFVLYANILSVSPSFKKSLDIWKFNISFFVIVFLKFFFQGLKCGLLKWHLRFKVLLLDNWLHNWMGFHKRLLYTRLKVGCNTRLNPSGVTEKHERWKLLNFDNSI